LNKFFAGMKNLMFIIFCSAFIACKSDRNLQTYLPVRKALDAQIEKNRNAILVLLSKFEATDLRNYSERALPIWQRASRIWTLSRQCDSIMASTQQAIIDKAGGVDERSGEVKKYANAGIVAQYMSDGQFGKYFTGFINERLRTIDKNVRESGGFPHNIEPPYIGKKWTVTEMGNEVPVAVALTKFSLLQLAISEYILSIMQNSLGYRERHVGCIMDRINVDVNTNTSMVIAGSSYEAYIYYAVNNIPIDLGKAGARVRVNDRQIPFDGTTGVYRVSNTKPGTYKWKGTITIKGADGTSRLYTTADQVYTVYEPAAIQLIKDQNIMYSGIDNKFSVFAPGVPRSQLKVAISNGRIIETEGKYIARIDSPGRTTITVTGKLNTEEPIVLCKTDYSVRAPLVK
jgi:hypothetical protein